MTDNFDQPTRNNDLKALIRTIPDHPIPGVQFRDVSTLLLDADGFCAAIDRLADLIDPTQFDLIAGLEARGFIVAAGLSYKLRKGKLMLRKKGKLPGATVGIDYALEYGTDRIEMHQGALTPGQRVLLVDDLLATGGTALAATSLLRGAGAIVSTALFVIDLPDLGGSVKLREAGVEPLSLVTFHGQ
jgi:adenine phosphoribosyltransferase